MSRLSESSKVLGLALVGYRGTGKSTVGRIVAERLGWPFHDADRVLERRFGQPIRTIFEEFGEPVFRDREELVLAELTTHAEGVIATGGGAIVRETNRRALRKFGFVIWLRARPEVLSDRLGRALEVRPGLTAAGTYAEIEDVLAARLPYYAEVADGSVETDGKTPEEVAKAVLETLSALPHGEDRL